MNRPYLISNILLQVALISSFIILIFFTYGVKLEKNILDRQIKFVVNKIKPVKDLFPDTDISNNISLIDSIKIKDDPAIIKEIFYIFL